MTRPHVTGWHQAGTDIRKRSCVILIAKPVPHSVTVFGTGLRRCDTQGGAGLHGLTAGGSGIRTFGTFRKEPLSLSLFGGFGPEVSRLCLCDSLPARSVRSQFRRDRGCYTEGAPLR